MRKSRAKSARRSSLSSNDALQQSLQKAINLQQKGNPAAAERIYRDILKRSPTHIETLQYLAILLQQAGNTASALNFMQKALDSAPENPGLLKNIAEIFRTQGNLGKAELYAKKALSFQANNVDALVILGTVYFQQQHSQDAIEQFTSALNINPDDVFARNELAKVLGSIGQHQKAAEHYKRALSQFPDFDECRINLADTLVKLKYYDEAIDHYQQVIKRHPKNAIVHSRLGSAFEKQGKIDQATLCYQCALEHNPKLLEARLNLGKIVMATDPHAAETWFSSTLATDPNYTEGHYWLGIHAQTMGKFEQSTTYFRQAIKLDPEFYHAWYRLSMNRTFKPSGEQLEILERRFNETIKHNPDDNILITLGFTLGRFQEQRGDYASAFEYFNYANRLKSRLHRFDKTQHDAQIEDIINTFDSGFYKQRNGWGNPSKLPVFIVGMPRSGTTLVEHILFAHPSIHGAGEILFMLDLVKTLKKSVPLPSKSHASLFKDLEQRQVTDLAQGYLNDLQALAPEAIRILDKLPGNYLRLGIIFLLFPGARIIHCKRDPMDTCWSCFAQNFEMGLHFTNDLENMGHAYRGYLNLMAHWQALFSDRILDIRYEDLLEDPEAQCHRLLRHCGLDWHPDVLNFTDQQRPVSTASLWQVRQPLYKTSIGRWKTYRQHLGPLQKILSL